MRCSSREGDKGDKILLFLKMIAVYSNYIATQSCQKSAARLKCT